MKIKLDKKNTRRARFLALGVDQINNELDGRLSRKDTKILEDASDVLFKISKKKVYEVRI